eukprot:6035338-Ditylum_brightwellii.AAC.1
MEDRKFILVVHDFCYLDSMITTDLRDKADVDNCIKKASKAFGALRSGIFFSKYVSFAAKKAIYTRLVLVIPFYGANAWSLTQREISRLKCSHAQFAHAMCRVTKYQT